MPGFDTAATIVSDVAIELGLISTAIADPFASTDQNIVQLTALLKPTGRALVKEHPWTDLTREYTFPTVITNETYPQPDDFDRFVDGTFWNRSTSQPIAGGLTPQEWQTVKATTAVGISQLLRIKGGLMWLSPVPTAEEDIYFEYISTNWGATEFTKEAPTIAADVIQFDPHLFTRALKLRFLTAKGMDTGAAFADYTSALALAKGQDGAAPTLRLGGGSRMPWPNVPETGFGQ